MAKLKNIFDANQPCDFPKFPVYRYDWIDHGVSEHELCPAFIELDLVEQTVNTFTLYDCEVPATVVEGKVLIFPINSYMSPDEIEQIIDDHIDDFQIIIDGAEFEERRVVFTGEAENLVFKFKEEEALKKEPSTLVIKLDEFIEALEIDFNQSPDIDHYVAAIIDANNSGHEFWLKPELHDHDALKSAIINEWCELLTCPDELTQMQAKSLLESGEVGPAWNERLTAIANDQGVE